MAEPGFPIAARPMATCPECGVPIAADQRYCVNCGARCVPLPADLAGLAITADTPLVAQPGLAAEIENRAGAFLSSLPPRAASLAVMSMLAFGVVVGSGATSLASPSSPVIVAYGPAAPAPASSPAAAAGGSSGAGAGGGGGGGGTTTVVQTVSAQTVTAPGGGGGGGGGAGPAAPSTPTGPTYPPVKHVFVVMLSTEGFKALFGPGSAYTYLNRTLRPQGELLENYYGVAGSPLANEIALISGQGPTTQTMQNCPQYTALTPGTIGKDKQAQGDGCVYPAATANLPDQLVANGQTWKAYIEGMNTVAPPPATGTTTSSSTTTSATATTPAAATTTAATTSAGATSTPGITIPTPAGSITGPTGSIPTAVTPNDVTAADTTATSTATTSASGTTTTGAGGTGAAPTDTQTACRHPALGTADAAQSASTVSPYVTWRNPFVYLQSITNSTECAVQDVGTNQLSKDLKRESTAPALAYIAPSPCDDGQLTACAPGQTPDPKTTAAATDAFLKTTITEIEASPAYRNGNGLIAITADNAPQTGLGADPSACCNNPVYPNLPATTTSGSTTSTGASTTPGDHHGRRARPQAPARPRARATTIRRGHGPGGADHHGHHDEHDDNADRPGRIHRPHRGRRSGRAAAHHQVRQAGQRGHAGLLQSLLAAGQHRATVLAGPDRLRDRPAAHPVPARRRLQQLQALGC